MVKVCNKCYFIKDFILQLYFQKSKSTNIFVDYLSRKPKYSNIKLLFWTYPHNVFLTTLEKKYWQHVLSVKVNQDLFNFTLLTVKEKEIYVCF